MICQRKCILSEKQVMWIFIWSVWQQNTAFSLLRFQFVQWLNNTQDCRQCKCWVCLLRDIATVLQNYSYCLFCQFVVHIFVKIRTWKANIDRFESCFQQRKTACLLSIRKSLACARASKLTTANMYIARARCECQMAVGSGGLNACWS